LYFAISAVVTGFVVSLGIRKGIEPITSILIPFSVAILLGMAAFCTTLSGFSTGLGFLFTPDFSVLASARIWSAAFGQAFFSLSVGFGALVTYGSYLDKGTNIPRYSFIITVSDLMVALLAGLVIFPLVFTFGFRPSMGAELAFSTLPAVFGLLPAGRLISAAFFLLLFFAALTSAIAMMEVSVAAVTETIKISRRKISLLLTIALLILGLPSALSYSSANLSVGGVRILDLLDETLGTMGLPIAALLTAVVFSWFLRKQSLASEIRISEVSFRLLLTALRWVIPTVLLMVTVSRIILSFDFAGWHFLPGIHFIGSLPQGLITLGSLVILVICILIMIRCLGLRKILL
jgi:NSS family neurotransmitter:Na+ symporter